MPSSTCATCRWSAKKSKALSGEAPTVIGTDSSSLANTSKIRSDALGGRHRHGGRLGCELDIAGWRPSAHDVPAEHHHCHARIDSLAGSLAVPWSDPAHHVRPAEDVLVLRVVADRRRVARGLAR